VLLVHAGKERGIELDLRADECMTVHVLADQAGAVRNLRQQQQVR